MINTLYAPWSVGGAERSVQLLAESLAAEGNDVTVATLAPDGAPTPRSVGSVDVRYLPLRNVYWPFGDHPTSPLSKAAWHVIDAWNPLMARSVRGVLASDTFDVVHTNNLAGFSAAVWHAARASGVPIVHTLRDYYLACPKATMFRRSAPCERQCSDCRLLTTPRALASRTVDAIVGISRFVLDRHLALGLFADVDHKEVIYNPYDPPPRPARREEKGIREPVVFGYLGRLSAEKGVEVALDAFRRLDVAPDRWSLRIGGTGDPDYVRGLRARAPDAAEFLGGVDSDRFFSSIDVLVVPSVWHEPMGRVVVEALGHGVPAVVAKRGGLPELVEEGRTGWVFDPEDPERLSTVLSDIVKHPISLHSMRTACFEASRAYSTKICTDRYQSVYQAVVERAAR